VLDAYSREARSGGSEARRYMNFWAQFKRLAYREVPADNGSYPDLNSRDWKRVLRGGGSSHMIHFMRMELKKLGNLPSTGSFRLPEAGESLDLGSLAFIEPLERDIQSHAPYLSAFLTMLPRPAHKKGHNPMKFGARQAIWAIIS